MGAQAGPGYHEQVGRGLDLLREGLSAYILREMQAGFGASWWKDGIEEALPPDWRGARPLLAGTPKEKFAALDAMLCS